MNNTLGHRIRPALATGLTATGTNQATAFPLTNNTLHEFISVPSSTGAILPVGTTPSEIAVFNNDTNTMSIYPPSGGTIDGGTANASVSLAAGKGESFWASSATNWYHVDNAAAGGSGTPGGSTGQIQYDNAGVFGGFTATGDATINTSTGAVTVTKTSGVAFAPSATTDTTNATNITSGSLALTELAAIGSGNVVANTTAGSAAPAGVTLSALVDAAIANTQGDVLYRGASVWSALPPGSAHTPLQSGGSAANISYNPNILLPTALPQRRVTGPIFSVTAAGTAVANSAAQTSLFTGANLNGTLTIPANTLAAGQAIRFFLTGTYGCTASAPNFQVQLFLGGTVIAQTQNTSVAAVAQTNGFWLSAPQIIFTAIGSSGACLSYGTVVLYEESGANVAAFNQGLLNGTSYVATPITVNTTGSLALDFQVQWGTANASNTIQLLGGYGELIG